MKFALSPRERFSAILQHATPILVAQLASISTSVVDTLIAARSGTIDLAAVGVGNGLFITVMLACAGVTQGLTPIAAHHFGAKRFDELRPCFQQGIWLCLALSIGGIAILSFPGWILALNHVTPAVAQRTRDYLAVIAWSLPGMLIYRCCGGMFNALGRPRMLMILGLCYAAGHALLAPTLAFGWLGTPALGAVGCAASMLFNMLILAALALGYLARSAWGHEFGLFRNWARPCAARLKELLKLGLPIGMSSFVEMSSFALIGLLVASLGAEQVGANRVAGSLTGICYMLPLAISIATLSQIGQAAGAQDQTRVRQTISAGLILGGGAAICLGLCLWLFARPVVTLFSPDSRVQLLALPLVMLIVFNQFFDAIQTVAAQSLRGLKIAGRPMLIHILSFWGVGLAGGWWLCYRGLAPLGYAAQGVAGFWQASILATLLASLLFGTMLYITIRRVASEKSRNTRCTGLNESASLPRHEQAENRFEPDSMVKPQAVHGEETRKKGEE